MNQKSTRYTETELIILLQSNDQSAFEYLYDHYAPALYGIICKIVNDDVRANDVMQDSFVKIWKHIKLYNGEKGTLFTWMLNISRRTAIDSLRAHQKFDCTLNWDLVKDNDMSALAISSNPVTLDMKLIVENLLPEKQRLIELVYFEGYTHEEASKHMSLPLGTVKSRIRKALIELRQLFGVSLTSVQFV